MPKRDTENTKGVDGEKPAHKGDFTPAEKKEFAKPLTPKEQELHGMRSVLEGGKLFCGVTEQEFAINGTRYQWPRGSKLTWGIVFSRLGVFSDMDVKDVALACFQELSSACDVAFEYTNMGDAANIYMQANRLDGPNGVLADCMLPVGNASTQRTRLRLRLDDGENWVISENPPSGKIDLYRVLLHELEHAMGLGHKPTSVTGAALIAPTYSRTIRTLQPLDIEELVIRYGKAVTPPPTIPPPTPGASPIRVVQTIEQGNKQWLVEGEAKRIK